MSSTDSSETPEKVVQYTTELSDNALYKIFTVRDRAQNSLLAKSTNGLIPYADQAALVGRITVSPDKTKETIHVSDIIVNSYGFDETTQHFQHNDKFLSLLSQAGGDLFIVGYFTTLSPSEHSVLSRMHQYQKHHESHILITITPKCDDNVEFSSMPIRSFHLKKNTKQPNRTSSTSSTSFYERIPTNASISLMTQLLQRIRLQRIPPLKYHNLDIHLDEVAGGIQQDISNHLYQLEYGNWKRNNTKALLHQNALVRDSELMQEHVETTTDQLKFYNTLLT